jgi:hypothetical protein
VFWVDVSS